MSKRNNIAGSAFEDEIVDQLNKSGLHVKVGKSSEYAPEMDRDKIDIVPIKESDTFIYNIQAKTSTKVPPFQKLLDSLRDKDGIPVVLYKQTERSTGDRFLTTDTFSILYKDHFLNLINDVERYKLGYSILAQYFDSISDEEQKIVHEELLNIGL